MFRPDANARRFALSAERLTLPALPAEIFLAAADLLVATDRAWVPGAADTSLYLRPFLLGTEVGLGVRPSNEALFVLTAHPAGSYFSGGVKPVRIWLSTDYVRAAPGGTGEAKCGGNYAASLAAQEQAIAEGCDQVVFLDAETRTWIEELGGMNLFFVQADGSLVTPALTGTILRGITRESLLTLCGDLGIRVTERRVPADEWRAGVQSGQITEVFACGTAAVISPIGALVTPDGEFSTGPGVGPVTTRLRQALTDVQYGHAPDGHGWLRRVPSPAMAAPSC
jgi:branched-chain amino acid aminotransferase